MADLKTFTVQELLHEYDRSFHEVDTEGIQNVLQECKRRNIDFWKVYRDHVISHSFTEEMASSSQD